MSAAAKDMGLGRNSLVYGGALLLPRIAAFAALIIFSRLLVPAEYGYFSLFVISAELINNVLFSWIRLAYLRLFAQSERAGGKRELRRTCLALTGLAVGVSVIVAAVLAAVAAPQRWVMFFALVSAMSFANGIVRMRLAELQAEENALRYCVVEVSRALLSLSFSVAFVFLIGRSFEALGSGFVAGNMVLALVCLVPLARDVVHARLDRPLVREIVAYAGPLIPSNLLEFLIPLSERLIIQLVAGPAAVGIYAAAQNLVQQPINMLFSAVALAAFPVVMRSVDTGTADATRAQIRRVGAYLLAIGVPAFTGLVVLRSEIAGVVLGEEFRGQATAIIPWVALTAILVNLKFHYVDLAFHVTRRMKTHVMTLLPSLVLTAPAIYFFLQQWGLPGAAAGSCLAFATSLFASWFIGRRLFPVAHAKGETVRILVAAVAMIGVLHLVGPLEGVTGLVALIAAGGVTYTAVALLLNVIGTRSALALWLAQLAGARSRAS